MTNIFVKLFSIEASGSRGDIIYRYFYFTFWQPFYLAEQTNLCNFRLEDYGKYYYEIISNLDLGTGVDAV